MDNLAVIIIVIVAVIIGAMFLTGIVRRSVGRAGRRHAQITADSHVNRILDDLGTPLVIHASEADACTLIDDVVRRDPRRFSPLGDDAYGIRFVEDDDAIVRLVRTDSGTRMQVQRSVERLGMPQNLEFWNELRTQVSSAATAQGISVSNGARLPFTRALGEPAAWVLLPPEADRTTLSERG